MECSTLSKKHDEKFKLLSCFACEKPIQDRFFSSVDGHFWHERCLVCHVCDRVLTSSCYIKDSTLFCKMDYWRCFGIRCQLCDEVLFPNQTVYNISLYPSNTAQYDATLQPEIIYFHEKCFSCSQCGRLLHPGERYVLRGSVPLCFADYIRPVQTGSELMDEESKCDKHPDLKCPGKEHRVQDFASLHPIAMENYAMAEYMKNTDEEIMTLPSSNESVKEIQDLPEEDECFELDSDSGSGKNSKRPRTILTTSQRRKFKSVFEVNPKPARKVRESLAQETGLNIRVVQVWFQNQRAKMKKLARRQAQGNTHQVNRKLFPCLNLTQVNPISCEDTENGIGSTETQISSSIQTAVTESDREKLEGAEFVPNMRSSVVSMERRSTLLDSNEGHFCKYFPLQPLTLHTSSELPTFYSTNNLDFQSDLYQPNPPAMEILERRSNYSQTIDAKEGQREVIEEPMRRLFPVPQNYLPSWCNDYP